MSNMTIALVVPVYNEEDMLRQSLRDPLKYVDEAVILDGSPNGPSTDGTRQIIADYEVQYPGKIKYLSGTYRMPNGSWDESTARNLTLANINSDFMIPHCGDMIYGDRDIEILCDAIRTYPEKRVFYCWFLEFWLDQSQIRLYPYMEWFTFPTIGDLNAIAMDSSIQYENGPHIIIPESYKNQHNHLPLPNINRYHCGWISGFLKQVEKHYRNITMGQWGEGMNELRNSSPEKIMAWSINHVLGYPGEGCGYPYMGEPPEVMKGVEWTYNSKLDEGLKDIMGRFDDSLYDLLPEMIKDTIRHSEYSYIYEE